MLPLLETVLRCSSTTRTLHTCKGNPNKAEFSRTYHSPNSFPLLLRVRDKWSPFVDPALRKCFSLLRLADSPLALEDKTNTSVDPLEMAMIRLLTLYCGKPDFREVISTPNDYNQTLLHWSVLASHTSLLKKLVHWGLDLSVADVNGLTALHCAYLKEDQESVRTLLSGGASDLARDGLGRVPAGLASETFNAAIMSSIIKEKQPRAAPARSSHQPLDMDLDEDSDVYFEKESDLSDLDLDEDEDGEDEDGEDEDGEDEDGEDEDEDDDDEDDEDDDDDNDEWGDSPDFPDDDAELHGNQSSLIIIQEEESRFELGESDLRYQGLFRGHIKVTHCPYNLDEEAAQPKVPEEPRTPATDENGMLYTYDCGW
jgi:hypothetical protein